MLTSYVMSKTELIKFLESSDLFLEIKPNCWASKVGSYKHEESGDSGLTVELVELSSKRFNSLEEFEMWRQLQCR